MYVRFSSAHRRFRLQLQLPEGWHIVCNPSGHEAVHQQRGHVAQESKDAGISVDALGFDDFVVVWHVDRRLLQMQLLDKENKSDGYWVCVTVLYKEAEDIGFEYLNIRY